MNNNRLTSITLFSELYNNGRKDVFHVIAEFIKAALTARNMRVFDSVQMKTALKESFSIDLPEAIIKTVLNNRLKDDLVRDATGQYLSIIENNSTSDFQEKEIKLNQEYDFVFNTLYAFFSTIQTRQISDEEKETIKESFIHFLLDEPQESDEYLTMFNAFIVQHQNMDVMMSRLNTVKDGLILYSGIQFSDPEDINNLGSWKNPMVIYLDTEHLFNLVGFNGELAQSIFLDFYKLVQEINATNKTKRIIEFRYFEETKSIVDGFFKNAERVIERKNTLDPSKPALINILDGCVESSDVLAKKAKFYKELQTSGVHLEEEAIGFGEWSLCTEAALNIISDELKQKELTFTEDEIYRYLVFFSRLNSLRQGKNNVGFEKCRYLMLTGNSIAHHTSRCVKEDKAVPFATDINFITSRMWFRLRKSFANGNAPKAFDIIARSQIVLSTQVSDSISHKYEQLKRKNYPQNELQDLYNELRLNMMPPTQITNDTLPVIMTFLSKSDIEDLRRERSFYRQKADENEELKEQRDTATVQFRSESDKRKQSEIEHRQTKTELEQQRRINRTLTLQPHKKRIRRNSNLKYAMLFWLFPVILLALLSWGIHYLLSPNDTVFGISTGVIGVLAIVWPSVKKVRKKVGKSFRKNICGKYAKIVTNAMID